MKALAADIGGTKTLLCLAETQNGKANTIHQHRYISGDYTDFDTILADFLVRYHIHPEDVAASCFAVAGPVQNHITAHVTNLPWKLSSKSLEEDHKLSNVHLINDFEAMAAGIDQLSDADLITVHPGIPEKQGPRAIVGAGTGLGIAFQFWNGSRYQTIASEGGHTGFAPETSLQQDLLSYLRRKHEHVSLETVLSGSGIINIFYFCCANNPLPETSSLRSTLDKSDDLAAAITEYARHHNEPVTRQTLNLFIEIYGGISGDLALLCMATGGVFLCGGIAAKLANEFQSARFVESFSKKGKMSEQVKRFPVQLVTNQEQGLSGAIAIALNPG